MKTYVRHDNFVQGAYSLVGINYCNYTDKRRKYEMWFKREINTGVKRRWVIDSWQWGKRQKLAFKANNKMQLQR